MPIPVKTLEEEKGPVRDRILTLLEANRSVAYSLEEIYAAIEGFTGTATAIFLLAIPEGTKEALRSMCQVELNRLIDEGKVRVFMHGERVGREFGTVHYYAAA